MKKVIESQKIVEKVIYIAEDGTKFEDEYICEVYEKYYNCDILDLVKDYIIFDEKAKKAIMKNKTPISGYAVCLKKLPNDMIDYIEMYMKNHHGAEDLIPICSKSGENKLYYCNYCEAMNGGYGWNGWESLGTRSQIEAEINRKEKQLAIFNSLLPKED